MTQQPKAADWTDLLPTKGGETTPLGYVLPDDMRDYHPYDHARRIGALVIHRNLDDDTPIGLSIPRGDHLDQPWPGPVIWLTTVTTPTQDWSVLTHELVHVEAGHWGRQNVETETMVEDVVVAWLVPLGVLRWALEEARTVIEAEYLTGVHDLTLRHALTVYGTDEVVATRWRELSATVTDDCRLDLLR